MLRNFRNEKKFDLIIVVFVILTVTLGCSMIRNLGNKNSGNTSPMPAAATPSASPSSTPAALNESVKPAGDLKSSAEQFTKMPSKTQLAKSAYIKGRIVLYVKDLGFGEKDAEWELDDLNTNLTKLAAGTPEDVGTVMLLSCTQSKKGDFEVDDRSGTPKTIPGYNRKCELTMVDRALDAIVYRKTFENILNNYKEVKADANRIDAPIPFNDVYKFLEGLPQSASTVEGNQSVGDIVKEFEKAKEEVGRKYIHKEITVRGFVYAAPQPPNGGTDGLLMLSDKEDSALSVTCWFSKADEAQFAKIKGDQFVTVKGVFSKYDMVELNSCKVVKIE